MARQELHMGDTITGMKKVSQDGEHIIAGVGTLELISNDSKGGKDKPARDSSTATSEGTSMSSHRRNRRANRAKHRSHSPLLDASWLRGDRPYAWTTAWTTKGEQQHA
eukprot:11059098-Heterocapsa_arctica.AAC.1